MKMEKEIRHGQINYIYKKDFDDLKLNNPNQNYFKMKYLGFLQKKI